MTHTTPKHYKGASELGKRYLKYFLGSYVNDPIYKGDLFAATENYEPWLLHDAYLFNACKYLWRLGEKGSDTRNDKDKALHYLARWQELPREEKNFEHIESVERAIKALKST